MYYNGILPPPGSVKQEGKLVQTITGTGGGRFLRRAYPTEVLRKNHVQKRRKPARRRRLSRRGWQRRSSKASPGSQIALWSSWRGYGGGFQLCDGLRSAGPKERQQTSSAEALELMVQQRPAERCAARVLRSVSGRYVRQQRLGTSSIDKVNGLGTVQRCQNPAVLLPLHGGLPLARQL